MPLSPPDLAGFTDAQHRLHDAFAEPVTFFRESTVTFPPGTPTDPETGKPYDPAVRATASGTASAMVPCQVAFRAVRRGDMTGGERESAIGIMAGTHVLLICPIENRSAIDGAIECELRGDRYSIYSQKPDGIGGVQRFLTYARLK